MKLEVDSLVYSDLLEILEYYDEAAGSALAAEFYAAFRHYAKLAAERPYSFAEHGRDVRLVKLGKFPHHFLFRIIDGSIVRILVVRHDRREQSFGLDRR